MSSTLIEVIASPVLACSVGLFFGPCASRLSGFRKSAYIVRMYTLSVAAGYLITHM